MEDGETTFPDAQQSLTTLLANLPGVAYRRHPYPHGDLTFVSAGCEELFGYQPITLVDHPGASQLS